MGAFLFSFVFETNHNVKIATNKDRDKVVEILYESFINITIPNSINFVINKSGSRRKRLKALMEFQFDMSMLFGKIFLNEEENSCILYLDKKRFNIKKFILEIKLLLRCIGFNNLFKVLKREKLIKSFHPKEDFVHLWLMAVIPDKQGLGIGSKLLTDSLKIYENQLIYVETTTPENLSFYKQNGFIIFHETFELDYPLFFLTKTK